jgi:cold shock CspA family protein
METDAVRGLIRTIKHAESFGFIRRLDNGVDYFFHKKSLDPQSEVPWDDIDLDMEVEFLAVKHPKGPRAEDVRVIGASY